MPLKMCQPCPRTCVTHVPGLYTDAKKSDRQPPQGDVVWPLGPKTIADETNSDAPSRAMSYGCWVQKPSPMKQTATNPAKLPPYPPRLPSISQLRPRNPQQPRRLAHIPVGPLHG